MLQLVSDRLQQADIFNKYLFNKYLFLDNLEIYVHTKLNFN